MLHAFTKDVIDKYRSYIHNDYFSGCGIANVECIIYRINYVRDIETTLFLVMSCEESNTFKRISELFATRRSILLHCKVAYQNIYG